MTPPSKYKLNDRCDWCGKSPAKEFTVQVNGVKTKRYAVGAMACAECERRLTSSDESE